MKYFYIEPRLKGVNHAFFTKAACLNSFKNYNNFTYNELYIAIDNLIRSYIKTDLNNKKIFFLNQNHSTEIKFTKNLINKFAVGDGIISTNNNEILCVFTADCVPVLLCNKATNQVCALHIGWRGALGGIIENFAKNFSEIEKTGFIGAIGPCIRNYEVDQKLFALFIKKDINNSKFFSQFSKEKYLFNLSEFCKENFAKNGIKNIYDTKLDTSSNEFFSARKKDLERQISIIFSS